MSRLRRPDTLDDALAALATDPNARPIAGGVGLRLLLALGQPVPDRLVAVGHLPELRQVARAGPTVAVGAALTLAEIADPRRTEVPALLRVAAGSVANPGVRASGTVAGNLVAGGATSDLLAAFVALDGRWELTGDENGPGGALAATAPDGSLIRALHCSATATGWGWQRLTIRGAMDRSCATVAAALQADGLRVALSVATPAVTRLPTVERISRPEHALDAAEADVAHLALRPDDRASVAYRRSVLPVLIERAVRAAFGAA